MDTILQIAKDYATLINSVLLIVLLFKYASDIRKQRLEYEKLERELKALRDREVEIDKKVLIASADEINHYVIRPVLEAINRQEDKRQDRDRTLLNHIGYTSNGMLEMLNKSVCLGETFTDLLEQNISVIKRLDQHLRDIDQRDHEGNKTQ